MTLSRWISDITHWWRTIHNPLRSIPEWNRADEAEKKALRRGYTQGVGRARRAKRRATHLDLAASCGRDWPGSVA